MDKSQKRKIIIVGAIEAVIVIFALVVSILVMATIHDPNEYDAAAKNLSDNGPMIGFFQNNSTAFLLIIVLPLFLILAIDVIYLIVYATKRESSLSNAERAAIEEQARLEAREEVLREMREEANKGETPKE